MTDSHCNKQKGNQEVIQNALTDINAYVTQSKDKEKAIRTLIGFCLKRRLAQDSMKVFAYLKEMTHISKDTFRMLTGLLHLLVESLDSKDMEDNTISTLFDFLKAKNLVDESTYSIIIKYHSLNRPDMAFAVITEMKSLGIQPHLRSYRMLLECAPNLTYLDKVYKSLQDDIAVSENPTSASSEPNLETDENPDAGLYDDSDEPKKRPTHLIPDMDTFFAIFTNLKKFSLSLTTALAPTLVPIPIPIPVTTTEHVEPFKYYLMEYRKYHTIVDSRIGALIESMVNDVKRVDIEPDGTVTGHPYKLQSIDISKEQQQELLYALYNQSPKTFKAFDLFMSNKTYDVVLDGANIALYNNTDFLAWKVIKAVIVYIKKGKKVLIILSHKRRDQELLKFVADNKGKVDIYWAGAGIYDDLVWLYASIKAACPLVTNDKMTDHIYYVFPTEKGSPPVFKVWMERHQVTYDFNSKGQFQLHEPSTYSCRIQSFDKLSDVWFLPVSDAEESKASYKWLMLHFK